jgi:predicted transcriptional regulator
MKTTVDLPDDLLIAAKKLAAERRTTLRSLIERGLRRELVARESRAACAIVNW